MTCIDGIPSSSLHFGRPKGAAESLACCRELVVTLLALRHFATGEADPVEGLFGKAEPLIHTGHDFDYLADQVALLVLYDFGDKIRPDSLAIFVKRELSVRGESSVGGSRRATTSSQRTTSRSSSSRQ